MNSKARPLHGFMLLLLALLIGQANRCGLLGRQLAHGLAFLFGAYGTGLMVVALVGAGLSVSGAAGVLGGLAKTLFRERAVRAQVLRRPANTRTQHNLPPIEVQVTVPRAAPALPTSERMRMTDLETALKNLGFRRNEYEPVLAKADPVLPLDTLVRGALKELRRN